MLLIAVLSGLDISLRCLSMLLVRFLPFPAGDGWHNVNCGESACRAMTMPHIFVCRRL